MTALHDYDNQIHPCMQKLSGNQEDCHVRHEETPIMASIAHVSGFIQGNTCIVEFTPRQVCCCQCMPTIGYRLVLSVKFFNGQLCKTDLVGEFGLVDMWLAYEEKPFH